jgi:hypothetical protein
MFASRFMPCPDCGASVDRSQSDAHHCDPERRADYRMFALRAEVAGLEDQFMDFLESSRGRFEVWVAAREVRLRRT